jgi:hypothetical protein
MDKKEIQKTIFHAKGELEGVWTLWERQHSHFYSGDKLLPVIEFDNVKRFAKFWNATKYNEISNFLPLEEDQLVT